MNIQPQQVKRSLPIVDSFQRLHSNLRISVTDRCNIRCQYCMPESVKFLPQRDLLNFEQITRLVTTLAPLGVDRIRLTGGEPLVRSQLSVLVGMLKAVSGISEVSMTTNAVLLADQADQLKQAGLDRLNISLDTVDPTLFKEVTRRDVLNKVFEGIESAKRAGFEKIKVNAVPLPIVGDDAIVKLAEFCLQQQLELRFIEFMPLDGSEAWQRQDVRTGSQLRRLINERVGKIEPVVVADSSQPAIDFQYVGEEARQLRIGFIDSVTQPFCSTCNRMRVTAEGKFRNCLFSDAEWDLREALRHGSDDEIEAIVREAIAAKKRGHGSDDFSFVRPTKAMYQIGG